MSDDLHYLSAVDAIRRFQARTLSPVELMQSVIDRAEQCEPQINAFTYSYFERALGAAKQAEIAYGKGDGSARPLEGIPLAVKDEAAIAGEPTSSGTLIPGPAQADTTTYCVERLLQAGAIVHARTATPEFACSGVTHSRRWGVTRNPWNTDFTPGGSSGGSAASLAAGTATLATGSDIWGSIRIPASCCGVVGFKPPHGRVPEESPYNLDWYCHEGPLARTVADCALMENVMAGPHERDLASLWPKLEIPDVLEGIEGWRIAYSMDLGYCEVHPEVVRNTEAALDHFRALGCEVVEVELGWTSATLGAAQSHLGHIFGNLIARELPLHRDLMTHYAIKFSEFGRTTTADDFIDAMTLAGEMYDTLGPILESHNVLICPTTGLPAVPAEHDSGIASLQVNGVDVDPEWGWLLTYPFNMMSRCPVMSVPSGRATNGVPTGIQIVGRGYDDVSVFRAAAAYEAARGGFELPAS